METQYMPKELVLFYVVSWTSPLFNLHDQFITVQVILPIPSHRVLLNYMLVFRMLRLKLFNIVILWNLKVVLGSRPTGLRIIWNVFKLRSSKSTLKEIYILWFQISVVSQRRIFPSLSINALVVCSFLGLNNGGRRGIMKGLPRNLPGLE